MFKLETQLAFFRFNSTVCHGNLPITWYALDEEEEGGRCFTQKELDDFTQYVINKPNNFPGEKNYHTCDDKETPYCGIYSAIPNENKEYPTKFILRKHPELSNIISDCVDIILTDTNGIDQHDYNLSFDVIGQFELQNSN